MALSHAQIWCRLYTALDAVRRMRRAVFHILLPGFILIMGVVIGAKGVWIGLKPVLADVLLHKSWVQAQHTHQAPKPWPSLDAYPIAKLSVPRLRTSEIVLSQATGQALAFAPAHMAHTPLPGAPGLSVIAAHKNTHFAFLKHIREGEKIWVEQPGDTPLMFEVIKADIIHKDYPLTSPILSRDQESFLALVTCYPFDALRFRGPLRYVVYAARISSKNTFINPV